jgi:hypothetical protein
MTEENSYKKRVKGRVKNRRGHRGKGGGGGGLGLGFVCLLAFWYRKQLKVLFA